MMSRSLAARWLAGITLATSLSTLSAQQTDETSPRQLAPVPAATGVINDIDRAAVAGHEVTPYIENSTAGVIDIDLSKIDVTKSAQWLFGLVGPPPNGQADQIIPMANGFVESLKAAGVKHIYVTVSTRSMMDGGPVVIVPCDNPTVVNGLATVLLQAGPKEPPMKIHLGAKLVVFGSAAGVDRVISRDGVSREELILPLREKDRLDHSIVLSLPAESKNELAALWPDQLPESSPIQFSPRKMAADVNRVVLSFRLPPEPQLIARVETKDRSAAERVKGVIEKTMALSPEPIEGVTVKVDIKDVIVEATPDNMSNLFSAAVSPARENARQMMRMNSLKQLGLAMHNYYSTNKHLPPRCLTDRKGKPLMSWRVTLLPYVEQARLYDALKLGEAWNSDHNKKLTGMFVPVFNEENLPKMTRFRVPVMPGSLWHGEGRPKEFRDVIDGTSNTIAILHAPADQAVEWANPEPWVISEDDPISDVFGDRDEVTAVFLDGSARKLLKKELDNKKLKALLTYAGREPIDW